MRKISQVVVSFWAYLGLIMPLVYTREEIKAYLGDRGFDVNDEEMISKFIHDLKKMIKHEDRQRRRVRLGHDPQDTVLDSNVPSVITSGVSEHATTSPSSVASRSHSTQLEIIPRERNAEDGAERRKVITDSQRRKDPRSERVLNSKGSFFNPNVSENGHPNAVDANRQNSDTSALQESDGDEAERDRRRQGQPRRVKSSQGLQGTNEFSFNDSNVSSIDPPRDISSVLEERNGDREDAEGRKMNRQRRRVNSNHDDRLGTNAPSVSSVNHSHLPRVDHPSAVVAVDRSKRHDETSELLYILGNILGEEEDPSETGSASTRKTLQGPPESVKRDPVALYHFYKKIWDKQSFPGDNRHMRLRWNVRAQTVGNYPCIDGQPVKYLR